jgi:NAD(P)-dependent dehydrogenase (short-subunit alcohol dehydrogenase family)
LLSFPSSVSFFLNLVSCHRLFGSGERVICIPSRVCEAVLLLTHQPQVQAALPSLRTTNGRIILTSSGASVSAYQGWGAYGSGKAVLNHLALTLSVEEPDVTTISVRPGVVDTEMQREIREVHHERMSDTDRTKFAGLKTGGSLLRPEQPGHVIAKLAAASGEEVKGLNGKFLDWNDESLSKYQEE